MPILYHMHIHYETCYSANIATFFIIFIIFKPLSQALHHPHVSTLSSCEYSQLYSLKNYMLKQAARPQLGPQVQNQI